MCTTALSVCLKNTLYIGVWLPLTFFFFFFPFQTSDYINASFMDGYKMTNAYIATQGKKPLFIILIPSAVCSSAFMFFWTNPELYYASSKKAVFASSGVFFRDIGWGERCTSLLISRSFGNVFWLFLFASCQAGTAQHLAFIPTSSCAHLFMVVASQRWGIRGLCLKLSFPIRTLWSAYEEDIYFKTS